MPNAPYNGPADGLLTSQVSVGTTAVQLVADRADRHCVKIATGSVAIAVGNSSSVTTSTGFTIPANTSETFHYEGPLYGIAASSTTANVAEIF